jgi:hypothetical protein
MKIPAAVLKVVFRLKPKHQLKWYTPERDHNSVQQAYYLLYRSTRNSLTDSEVAAACTTLLELTPESILTDIGMELRAERMLDHDNIPAEIFEELITTLDPAVLVNPYNGVAHRLLLNHGLNIANYSRVLHLTNYDPELMEQLLTSTDLALKHAAFMLTYKIVLSNNRSLTTMRTVTWKTHKKNQKMYLVLVQGKALVEKAIRQEPELFAEQDDF